MYMCITPYLWTGPLSKNKWHEQPSRRLGNSIEEFATGYVAKSLNPVWTDEDSGGTTCLTLLF